jgi:hypothetical protein
VARKTALDWSSGFTPQGPRDIFGDRHHEGSLNVFVRNIFHIVSQFLARSPKGVKRRKMNGDSYILISEDEEGNDSNGEVSYRDWDDPDEKPNFFGDDDDDDGIPADALSSIEASRIRPRSLTENLLRLREDNFGSSSGVVKPKSASSSAVPTKRSDSATGVKAASNGANILICPICNRALETDNAGLNAHVDFCLSRGAIFDASARGEASSSQEMPKDNKATGLGKGVKRKNPFVGIK